MNNSEIETLEQHAWTFLVEHGEILGIPTARLLDSRKLDHIVKDISKSMIELQSESPRAESFQHGSHRSPDVKGSMSEGSNPSEDTQILQTKPSKETSVGLPADTAASKKREEWDKNVEEQEEVNPTLSIGQTAPALCKHEQSNMFPNMCKHCGRDWNKINFGKRKE